jgi:mRNA interferase RelE/StbE
MKVAFEASFARDLKHVRDRQTLKRVQQVIEAVKAAPSISAVQDLKKMQGYDTYYRIRLGDYRIGIEVVEDQVIFVRFLHRKDAYRYFP